jgi:MoxR-like ATPase
MTSSKGISGKVDKRVAEGLAEAMAKARGKRAAAFSGSILEDDEVLTSSPVEPEEVVTPFKDESDGVLFSKVFGEVPKGFPDLKAVIYKKSDWHKDDRGFIPSKDKFKDYVPNITLLYQLWVSVLRNNKKALVVGPTGSGKSSLQEYFCAHINQPLYRINGRGDMESDTILGRPWVDGGSMRFEKGELVKAAEKGWWILIDEPWKLPAPIQMALQRFYEKDGQFQLDDMQGALVDKVITPKPSCRVVLCDNVVGTGDNVDQYAATMIQDGSTLNRIDVVFRQDYMAKDLEVEMIRASIPAGALKSKDMGRMVDFFRLCRVSYEQRALSAALSPRNLLTWADLSVQLGSIHAAAAWTLTDRFAEDDEKALVNEHYRTTFDTRIGSMS